MRIHREPDPLSRRQAVRRLLTNRSVSTQEELRELLAEEGFDVTQATLSRDLARLGARRVALPSGGTVYELRDPAGPAPQEGLGRLKELVLSVEAGDGLVVVKTLAGAASAVAASLDYARLPEVLGSIAGDDTIFIAPAKGLRPERLQKRLRTIWSHGETL